MKLFLDVCDKYLKNKVDLYIEYRRKYALCKLAAAIIGISITLLLMKFNIIMCITTGFISIFAILLFSSEESKAKQSYIIYNEIRMSLLEIREIANKKLEKESRYGK